MKGQMTIFDFINHPCKLDPEQECNFWAKKEQAEALGENCNSKCCAGCKNNLCGARCGNVPRLKEKNVKKRTVQEKEDFTFDRYGRKRPAPKWLKYKRCENCILWVRSPEKEQPPEGWGVYGFCQNRKNKCDSGSYCQAWEERTEQDEM